MTRDSGKGKAGCLYGRGGKSFGACACACVCLSVCVCVAFVVDEVLIPGARELGCGEMAAGIEAPLRARLD